MTTTKQYDRLNRLLSIASVPTGTNAPSLPLSHAYVYNAANQRIRATLADGSYWIYTYDCLGQVTTGKRYWQDGTPVAGQQFEYSFDDIGNRKSTAKATAEETKLLAEIEREGPDLGARAAPAAEDSSRTG